MFYFYTEYLTYFEIISYYDILFGQRQQFYKTFYINIFKKIFATQSN